MKIPIPMILAVAFLLTLTACRETNPGEICNWLGVCEPPPPPAEQITIICDASRGSGCNPESLTATVTALLEHIVDKPQSRLQLWTLGADVASTQPVAEVVIQAPERSGVRAIEAHQKRQIEDGLYAVRRGIKPYFDDSPPTRSPLIGGLAKLSLTTSKPSGPWHVAIVSDGLQFGEGYDWECEPPRAPEAFQQSIHDSGILTPDSFKNASISFVYLTLSAIDGNRCEVEVSRARAVRDLWTFLLTASGARKVTFDAGLPNLEALHESNDSIEEGQK